MISADRRAAFLNRIAGSWWRLLALVVVGLGAPLALLYLLRGTRAVLLGAGGMAAAGLFLLCFARPFATLVASLCVFSSGLDVFLPGPVSFALVAIVVARALFDSLSGRVLDWGTTPFRVALTLLLAIALTSLLMARSFAASQRVLLHMLWGMAFLLGISAYVDRSAKVRALLTAAVVGFAVSVVTLLVRILSAGGLLILLQPTGTARVGVGDPNFTAVQACVLLLPLAHLMGRGSLWRRLAFLPVLVLLIGVVILSASRIGMGLLVLASLLLVLRTRRARPFALLGLVGVGAVLLNLPSKYWVRFTDLGQLGGILIDRSLRLRQHALEAGWEIFREHPWLGVGLGNFPAESPRYMSVPLWAHNTYLDVAATLGVFGFCAYVAWQLSALAMVGRAYRLWGIAGRGEAQALAFALGTALVLWYLGAMTLDLGFYPALWIFMGLANAVRRCAEMDVD